MTKRGADAGGVWETIATEAERESPLWGQALLPPEERTPVAVFSSLGAAEFALGLETIYEGYLLHHGRPRLFEAGDRDSAVLLGDYLYAHGLVRIARLGKVEVVADLAELVSLCSQLRAERSPGDGAAWAATVVCLGGADGRLESARAVLREGRDPGPLVRLAEELAGQEEVARALALHRERVE